MLKNKLHKTNLEKLGNMTLDEKIEAAAKTGGTAEEQATVLEESLTNEEHGKIWGRHQTHLQKNPLEKGESGRPVKERKGHEGCDGMPQRQH